MKPSDNRIRHLREKMAMRLLQYTIPIPTLELIASGAALLGWTDEAVISMNNAVLSGDEVNVSHDMSMCVFCGDTLRKDIARNSEWILSFHVRDGIETHLSCCPECTAQHLYYQREHDRWTVHTASHEADIVHSPTAQTLHGQWLGPTEKSDRLYWLQKGTPSWTKWLQLLWDDAETISRLAAKAKKTCHNLGDLQYRFGDYRSETFEDVLRKALRTKDADLQKIEHVISMSYTEYRTVDVPNELMNIPDEEVDIPDSNGGKDFEG